MYGKNIKIWIIRSELHQFFMKHVQRLKGNRSI